MYQNYPNPFTGTTTVSYYLPKADHVSIQLYDCQGRLVTTLVNEEQTAGAHSIEYNGTRWKKGAYFYRFSTRNYSQTKPMLRQE